MRAPSPPNTHTEQSVLKMTCSTISTDFSSKNNLYIGKGRVASAAFRATNLMVFILRNSIGVLDESRTVLREFPHLIRGMRFWINTQQLSHLQSGKSATRSFSFYSWRYCWLNPNRTRRELLPHVIPYCLPLKALLSYFRWLHDILSSASRNTTCGSNNYATAERLKSTGDQWYLPHHKA